MSRLPISCDTNESHTLCSCNTPSFLTEPASSSNPSAAEAEMVQAITLVGVFLLSLFLQRLQANPVYIHKPWENKNLFEGDIVLRRDITGRSVVAKDRFLWPNGVIYYGLAPSLEREREIIESAMKHIESKTCLRFEENVSKRSYVVILKDEGCYSHIGRDRTPQPLSLGRGCLEFGTIVHELLHAAGFYHEHTRPDRDEYIKIFWENIDPEYEDQFTKLLPSQNRLINNFDYDSIMMYGGRAFSIDDESLTMKPTQPDVELVEVQDKMGLSNSDVERINTLYRCPS